MRVSSIGSVSVQPYIPKDVFRPSTPGPGEYDIHYNGFSTPAKGVPRFWRNSARKSLPSGKPLPPRIPSPGIVNYSYIWRDKLVTSWLAVIFIGICITSCIIFLSLDKTKYNHQPRIRNYQ